MSLEVYKAKTMGIPRNSRNAIWESWVYLKIHLSRLQGDFVKIIHRICDFWLPKNWLVNHQFRILRIRWILLTINKDIWPICVSRVMGYSPKIWYRKYATDVQYLHSRIVIPRWCSIWNLHIYRGLPHDFPLLGRVPEVQCCKPLSSCGTGAGASQVGALESWLIPGVQDVSSIKAGAGFLPISWM